jgi:hypothetical protein
MITYVRFNDAISIGGDFGSIESWSAAKHDGAIELVEKGSWLHLIIKTGATAGERRRVPITSVSYIADTGEPASVEGKPR